MAETCPCGVEGVSFASFKSGPGGLALVADPKGLFAIEDGLVREARKSDKQRFRTHWCGTEKASAKK